MGISLKAGHLKRYKDIGYLFIKYGWGDLVKGAAAHENALWPAALEAGAGTDGESSGGLVEELQRRITNRIPIEELPADLEALGPTFVEAGKWLSAHPDYLPAPYLEVLSQIGKDLQPMSVPEVRQLVECELGVTFGDVFEQFESQPISLSALEQTHLAILNGGKRVVVKIQRPDIREQVLDDLDCLNELASVYDQYTRKGQEFEFRSVVEDFSKIILSELDYRLEAHNLKVLKENLKDCDRIVVPQPLEQYSTQRLLVINHINGKPLMEENCRGLLRSERTKLASEILYAYLKQFLVDGFAQIQLDDEDLLLTDDGKIAVLDLGVIARIAPAMQEKMIQILSSIAEGRAEQAALLLSEIGRKREGFDARAFRKAVADLVLVHRDMAIEQVEIGRVFRSIAQAAVRCGIVFPSETTMLGSVLFVVDHAAHVLDPKFDAHSFMRRHVADIMQHHMRQALSPSRFLHTVLETTEFLEKLPGKIGQIFDLVASNQLKFTVHTIDEQLLMSGCQKIANRITAGLILAALIVGAANLMHIRTAFTIGGYPGLAMLCFIGAAGLGFMLVLEILISDRRAR